MEFRSVRIALTLTVLLGILMVVFSCNNTSDVANGRRSLEGDPMTTLAEDDPCKNTDEANRVSEIQRYLNTHSMRDEDLNDQRYSNRFKFHAESYNASNSNLKVLVRAYGRVVGQDDDNNNKPPKMKNFLKFLDKGMRKGCIDRVSFESMPTSAANSSSGVSSSRTDAESVTSDGRGFEWQTCPHPEFPCDTGRCSSGQMCKTEDEPKPSPTPTPTSTP